MKLDDLKARLPARDALTLGYWGDADLRPEEGNVVLRELEDGTWETATFGRGGLHDHRQFADEDSAVADLALSYLGETNPVDMSDVELEHAKAELDDRVSRSERHWWKRLTHRRRRL